MKVIPTVPKVAAAAAVLLSGAVAFALPAGADVSISSPPVAGVQIGSPATVDARGAAVTVPVTTVCAAGASFASVSVTIAQTSRGGVARGSGGANVSCTGTLNTVGVTILANDKPFKPGVAFAQADLAVCDFTGCRQSEDQREIRVVR